MASLPDLLPLAAHAFFQRESRETRMLSVSSGRHLVSRRLQHSEVALPSTSRVQAGKLGSAAQGREGALCSNLWSLQGAQQEASKKLMQDKIFSCFKD